MKFSPTITNWKKETLIIYPWPCVFKRSEYKKEKQHAFFALNIYNKVLCLYLNQRHLRVRTGTVSSYPGLIKWTQRSNERGMCKEINFYRPHADFPRKLSKESIRNNSFQAKHRRVWSFIKKLTRFWTPWFTGLCGCLKLVWNNLALEAWKHAT